MPASPSHAGRHALVANRTRRHTKHTRIAEHAPLRPYHTAAPSQIIPTTTKKQTQNHWHASNFRVNTYKQKEVQQFSDKRRSPDRPSHQRQQTNNTNSGQQDFKQDARKPSTHPHSQQDGSRRHSEDHQTPTRTVTGQHPGARAVLASKHTNITNNRLGFLYNKVLRQSINCCF